MKLTKLMMATASYLIIFLMVLPSISDVQAASGTAIIAIRTNSALDLGHIGVGYQNTNGKYLCGSVEGKDNNPNIKPGDDNGAWIKACDNIDEVKDVFSSHGYDRIRLINSGSYYPDPKNASKIIGNFINRGYNVLVNNCLTAANDVLIAYGVPNLPEPTTPNSYFDRIPGTTIYLDFNINCPKPPSELHPITSFWLDKNGNQLTEVHYIIGSQTGQTTDAFRMLVIGDSIAWGNGLKEENKYYYHVAKWIQKTLNKPIEVVVRAHSGTTIVGPENNGIQTDPNLNNGYPSLEDQAYNINDANDIDLILVSGGINDVGLDNVLNQSINANGIRKRSGSIENPMKNMLTGLLGINKKCKIIVTGYYPIVSDESNADDLTVLGGVLNWALNNPQYSLKENLRVNSYTFYRSSMKSLINATNEADGGMNRVRFAGVSFTPNRSYGTSGSWLWKLVSTLPPRTDDELFECRASFNNPTDVINRINAIGHPNIEGAREYNRSIIQNVSDAWPDWLHPTVLAFNVTPPNMTSGGSFTISYNISSKGGSGLKQVELWRKDEQNNWQQIKINNLSGENGSLSGSFTDSPSTPGKYRYGLHVVDNAGNWNDEKNSNTKNQPGIYGPIEVEVKKAGTAVGKEHFFNISVTNSAGYRVNSSRVVIDGTYNNTTDAQGELVVSLEDGNHTVDASKPGYGTGRWEGYLNHTQNKSINITLRPIPKYLFTISAINSAAFLIKGAEIKVNGSEKGATGPRGDLNIELTNGNYTIDANKTGYGTGTWTGELNHTKVKGAVVMLNGPKEYPFKIIAVNSAGYTMQGVNVSIDGKEKVITNQSGALKAMLTNGNHAIEANKTDYGSGKWTGTIDYNQSKEIVVKLNGPLEYPFNVTVVNAANYTIEGAVVSTDGMKKGVSDREGNLRAFITDGNHTIKAIKAGYGSGNWSGVLNHTQEEGILVKLNGSLEYPFNISVASPAGYLVQAANVKADGKLIGLTDANGALKAMLTNGNHTVEANKTGYHPGNWTGRLNHTQTKGLVIKLGGSSIVMERKPIDLCLVLDTSGSMADTECGRNAKVEDVKEAAIDTIASFIYPGSLNRVAVVSFSDVTSTVQGFTNNASEAELNVSQLSAGGSTSFGLGLSQALIEFGKLNRTNHIPAIIFMSDGMHNTPPDYPYYISVCRLKGIRVFTVGYGSEADHGLLREMAAISGGEYLFADPCGNRSSAIVSSFIQHVMRLSGWKASIIESGVIAQNQTINATSFIAPVGAQSSVIIVTYPGSHLKVILIDPDGKIADPKGYIYSEDKRVISLILQAPKPGKWTVRIFGDKVNGTEPYSVYISPKYVPPTIPSFSSTRSITVKETSGETLRNYPVRVTLASGKFPNDAKANGSDITIFDDQGTELKHWIEEWDTKARKAEIWVKVPEIPANGIVRLTILPGSLGAPAENNGSEIFDFFDDFSGSQINTTMWKLNATGSGSVANHDRAVYIHADARSRSSADLISSVAYSPNISIRFRANVSAGQTNDRKGLGFLSKNVGLNTSQAGSFVCWRGQDYCLFADHYFYTQDAKLSSAHYPFDNKYTAGYRTWEIRWLKSDIEYSRDGVPCTHRNTGMPPEGLNVRFSLNNTVSSAPLDIMVDWVAIRKCAAIEPKVDIN